MGVEVNTSKLDVKFTKPIWEIPAKVAVLGQMPASLLLVPKSDILTTPL